MVLQVRAFRDLLRPLDTKLSKEHTQGIPDLEPEVSMETIMMMAKDIDKIPRTPLMKPMIRIMKTSK